MKINCTGVSVWGKEWGEAGSDWSEVGVALAACREPAG